MTSSVGQKSSRVEPLPSRVDSRIAVDVQGDCRSSDSVAELSRELNDACTSAVTPHQVAALLEAEGLNDRIVKQRYGRAGVFALANELYEMVPLRRSNTPVDPQEYASGIHQPSTTALIMRGPIYFAPVLFFVSVSELFSGTRMLVAGLLALLFVWSWNQGFGSITYRLIGRGDVPGAKLIARISLLTGTIVVTAATSVVVFVAYGTGIPPVLFAAGQTAYLIGASTLLVFGRDRALVLALLPGVAVAVASMITDVVPERVITWAAVATLALVSLTVLSYTRNKTRALFPHVSAPDVRLAFAYAALGMMWAILIALAGVSILGTENVLVTVSVSAAAMVLTMGVAEWQLITLRRWSRVLLVLTTDPQRFGTAARWAFVRALLVFTSAMVVSTVFVMAAASFAGSLTPEGGVLSLAFVFLGGAFFAGLALVAMGQIMLTLVGSLALAVVLAGLFDLTPMDGPLTTWCYTGGCAALCITLVVGVLVTIHRPVAHR